MTEKLTTFDPAAYLETHADRVQFIAEALETGDSAFFVHALGIVARAQGMTSVAQEAGMQRESLYKSLSEQGNPSLKTALSVLKVLGIKLTAQPA